MTRVAFAAVSRIKKLERTIFMIYLLEDDASIAQLVCYSLNKTGNEAVCFSTPSEFFTAVESELPELVILDVMLPEEDGLSVLSKLRASARTENVPVIMLTAKDGEFDKVTALNAGADDYVTKPFGVMELIARVGAVLRRARKSAERSDVIYSIGDLRVSTAKREVFVKDKAISLTYKEFELLVFLFENRGAVMNRDKILTDIWGYEFDGENRTVDVHIRTLRQKLGDAADVIETVRGVGYKISEQK